MSEAAASQRSLTRFLPLAAFALIAALFFLRLFAGDASRIPSALIGKPAPAFALPAVEGLDGVPGFSLDDLKQGHVSVINVFASWCGPCHAEHPTLMALAQEAGLKAKGVRIYGVSYKDGDANTRKFLNENGNPYAAVGMDFRGRAAIDFGVYGVPETFVVKGDGTIAYKFVGPLTPSALGSALIPQIDKAMAPAAP